MKPPKEPKSFKYPRLYWAEIKTVLDSEFRIIYPDREPQRSIFGESVSSRKYSIWKVGLYEPSCCWYKKGMTPHQQVKAMKKYLKSEGRKAVFVGEIK